MKLKRSRLIAAAVIIPLAAGLGAVVGQGSAWAYIAAGSVTCTGASGPITYGPPLQLPPDGVYGVPSGNAGPVKEVESVSIDLSGCTSTDSSVTFTGLYGTDVDGVLTGTISLYTPSSDSLFALPGHASALTVDWVGAHGNGNAALANSSVSFSRYEPEVGSGSLAGHPSLYFGYAGDANSTIFYPLAPGTYGFNTGVLPDPASPLPPGGTTTDSTASTTNGSSCVMVSDLVVLETAAQGDLKDDPISGAGLPPGDYITSVPNPGMQSGCINVHQAATATASDVTITIGLPLVVNGFPALVPAIPSYNPIVAVPTWTGTACSLVDATFYLTTGGDGVCAEQDLGDVSAAGVSPAKAAWIFGSVASSEPSTTVGLWTSYPNVLTVTGSFAQSGPGASGDLVDAAPSQSDLISMAQGNEDSYGNPCTLGICPMASVYIAGTDGLTL